MQWNRFKACKHRSEKQEGISKIKTMQRKCKTIARISFLHLHFTLQETGLSVGPEKHQEPMKHDRGSMGRKWEVKEGLRKRFKRRKHENEYLASLPAKLAGNRHLLVSRELDREQQARSSSENRWENAGESGEHNASMVVVPRSCSTTNGLTRPVNPPPKKTEM